MLSFLMARFLQPKSITIAVDKKLAGEIYPPGRTRLSGMGVGLKVGPCERRVYCILGIPHLQLLAVDLQQFAKRQEQTIDHTHIAINGGLYGSIDLCTVADELSLIIEQVNIFVAIELGNHGVVCSEALYL